MSEPIVRAGGGIVWRHDQGGAVEIVLVHRPAHDDWSFPKGKLHPGETEAQAALREVQEETGLRCRLGREVGTSSYLDPKRRPKTVRYWEMRPTAGTLGPANEIDDARWVPLGEAPCCSATTTTGASLRVGSRLGERSRLSSYLER
jgi:8-oxo-dGTP pyrophosphatase MutT (NUDIX family)